MQLVRADFDRVRNVADGTYAFAHSDGRPFDVALVTGPAASGKTTMLEAIGMAKQRIAPAGRPARPRDFLRAGESNGGIELTFVLSDDERQRFSLPDPVVSLAIMLSGAPPEIDARIVALFEASETLIYFPANRRLSEPVGMEPPPDPATERRIRLSADPDKYRGVVPWLRSTLVRHAAQLSARVQQGGMVMAGDAPDPLDGFRKTLATLCPWLRLEGLALDGRTPMFLRRDGSNPPMFELSAAEQDAVLLSATLHRHDEGSPIVMVDRLDLHAHPDDQMTWLSTLRATCAGQLIVTATSERIRREVPDAQHVMLTRA